MRPIAALLLFAFACAKPAKDNQYPMTATIVSRDPAQNVVTLDNKDVPGVMEPMRMDYALRDAKVASLPPNGTEVTVTLHEREGEYWITDVRAKKPSSPR